MRFGVGELKNDFKFSQRSQANLENVHPELVRVTYKALSISRYDFGVSEGVREYERQIQLLRDKRTTVRHSEHFIQKKTGFGHAIDIYAFVNGKAQFEEHGIKYYGPIIQAFTTAAIMYGTQIQFGHLWKDFRDSFHIQLNPRFYR